MFLHYLKIAWRNLRKYKTQTIISIMGLAIGFTAFAFTVSWIRYEQSYDHFITDADKVHRVLIKNKQEVGGVSIYAPDAIAAYLAENYPEVEAATSVMMKTNDYTVGETVVIPDCRFLWTDPSFFKVFYPESDISFPNILPKSAIVLTEKAARLLQIDKSLIGTFIDSLNFTLIGIVPDVPANTNVPFDVLHCEPAITEQTFEHPWNIYSRFPYVRLIKNADIKSFQEKIDSIQPVANQQAMSFTTSPLRQVHYTYPSESANIKFWHLKIFAGVALLVILCALFNHLMLFVNRIRIRSRELALRKVNGAASMQLIGLLSSEFLLILISALFIGGVLTELLFPQFIKLSAIEAPQSFFAREMLLYAAGMLLFSMFTAIVPLSFYMKRSIRETIQTETLPYGGIKNGFSLISITLQLLVGILLIFCTSIFFYQFHFLNQSDIGFNRHNVNSFRSNILFQSTEIEKISGVEKAIAFEPIFLPRSFRVNHTHVEENIRVEYEGFHILTPDFFPFFEIDIKEGRNFRENEFDACIINETAKHALGSENVIGRKLSDKTIVGVIADMHVDSPLLPVRPAAYILKNENYTEEVFIGSDGQIFRKTIEKKNQKAFNAYAYRFSDGFKVQTEQAIRKLLEDNGYTRDVAFFNMDEFYNDYTKSERYLLILLGIMTAVAILVTVFGIYSMITLSCNQRRKEIAIRKVNGAKAKEILALFLKQYFWVTVLACVAAFPVGVYVMQRWLEQYTRRVSMEWWLFAGVVLVVAVIIFASIFMRVWRAANENPAEVVKSE